MPVKVSSWDESKNPATCAAIRFNCLTLAAGECAKGLHSDVRSSCALLIRPHSGNAAIDQHHRRNPAGGAVDAFVVGIVHKMRFTAMAEQVNVEVRQQAHIIHNRRRVRKCRKIAFEDGGRTSFNRNSTHFTLLPSPDLLRIP